jgi:hypothetical protein
MWMKKRDCYGAMRFFFQKENANSRTGWVANFDFQKQFKTLVFSEFYKKVVLKKNYDKMTEI